MPHRNPRERRCSYVVVVEHTADSADALRDLASYLSEMNLAGCDVVVLDRSSRLQFELNARVLRWVARHVAVRAEHCSPAGTVDVIRAAAMISGWEKVIVANEDVRYTADSIGRLCELLDRHEVVEPQDYLNPLPLWSGIEAARILVHRAIDPQPDHGATFGFRRSMLTSLTTLGAGEVLEDQVRRLGAAGAEVYAATDVFVRREPSSFRDWLADRPREAVDDFTLPMKNAFFFSLLPLLGLLALFGGLQLAGGYASVIAFASVGLAIRGRFGAGAFFPLRACLLAPIWVFERSFSVYWALLRKIRGTDVAEARVTVAERRSGNRVASGE